MLALIVILLFALAVAFFAGQNTVPVTVYLSNYQLPTVPLYVVVVGSMLIGFFVSWLVSLVDTVFNVFALRGKDSRIQASEKRIAKLKDRIYELEVENARYKGEHNESMVTERSEERNFHPSFLDRLRHTIR